MAYYKQSYNQIYGIEPKVTRQLQFQSENFYYKTIILEKIVHQNNPNNRHIREWLKEPNLTDNSIKRMLLQLQEEGLIKIEIVDDRGKIRRFLKLINN